MTLTRFWGVAENGESMELAVRHHLVDELLRRWPPVGLERRDQRAGDVVAQRGLSDDWIIIPDREESGSSPPVAAWDQLEQSMTIFAATRLVHRVAVHAAVLAWGGRAIVVPAASGGGKSTLSVAASKLGARVLSDEYALIDPSTGMVSGWARPVRLRRDDGSSDRLPIAVASDPLPVGLLAFLTHRDGPVVGWRTITPAEAVGLLLGSTICARDRPDDSFDAALAVARSAAAVAGDRGDAEQAAAALLAHLGDRP